MNPAHKIPAHDHDFEDDGYDVRCGNASRAAIHITDFIRKKEGRMQSQKQDVREPDNTQSSAATPVRNVQPISAGHSVPADRRNTVQHKSFIRRALNRMLHLLCRFLPGAATLRPFLHRMRGMRSARMSGSGKTLIWITSFQSRSRFMTAR